MDALTLFQKLLLDNKLNVQFAKPRVHLTEEGGVVIDQPQLIIGFSKEGEYGATQPGGTESTTETITPTHHESEPT